MRRGTDPQLKFKIPYTADLIDDGYVTFNQKGETVIEKMLSDEDVTITDYSIAVVLSQEETLKFSANCKYPVMAQIRIKLDGGTAVASNIVEIPVGAILKDGVI